MNAAGDMLESIEGRSKYSRGELEQDLGFVNGSECADREFGRSFRISQGKVLEAQERKGRIPVAGTGGFLVPAEILQVLHFHEEGAPTSSSIYNAPRLDISCKVSSLNQRRRGISEGLQKQKT